MNNPPHEDKINELRVLLAEGKSAEEISEILTVDAPSKNLNTVKAYIAGIRREEAG